MRRPFKVGDHVTWNSEAGHVSGTIIRVHTRDVDYKGYTHHASKDEPQYEIKSGNRSQASSWKLVSDTKTCGFRSGAEGVIPESWQSPGLDIRSA